jgi:hypothetical protein
VVVDTVSGKVPRGRWPNPSLRIAYWQAFLCSEMTPSLQNSSDLRR